MYTRIFNMADTDRKYIVIYHHLSTGRCKKSYVKFRPTR